MLPSRAPSVCAVFIIWCSVAQRGRRGHTVDLIRFVFTLSPRQEGHRIWSHPTNSDREEARKSVF